MKTVKVLAMVRWVAGSTLVFQGAAAAWTPGSYQAPLERMQSRGFTVNNHDRNDVIAFWHAVYQASEGYEARIGWTGDYSGNNGTVSAAFVNDVERRLNYFRAMCGVSSSAVVNSHSTVVIDPEDPFKPSPFTLKATACQNAALMLIRNYNPTTGAAPALTHNPLPNLVGWSPSAWNATSKGSFAFGLYGPGAITEYMIEQLSSSTTLSSWNSLVGHRRWNLYPDATVFATGDQPGTSALQPPTNVFYVLQKPDERHDAGLQFVAYPAAGFFPAPINSPYWSLSCARADFSTANVRMSDSTGNAVAIVSVKRNNEYGHPAIVWQVSPAAAARAVSGDLTFHVEISGIGGDGIPSSHRYSVTLVDPDFLTSDQLLSGPSSASSNGRTRLGFTPPAGAEALLMEVSRKSAVKWKETAESASKAKIIDGTAKNYPLISSGKSFVGFGALTGGSAFRLTFPSSYDLIKRGIPEQTFELDRDIIAGPKAKLTFQFRRGFMTRNSVLAVERSTDGGVIWKSLGAPIKGVSDTQFDAKVSMASYLLPPSSAPVRIRFRLFTTGGAIYTHEAAPKSPTGIFLDEIATTNTQWLEVKRANPLAAGATTFDFDASSAGGGLKTGESWYLRLRTRLGGKWFPLGPAKVVAIGAP